MGKSSVKWSDFQGRLFGEESKEQKGTPGTQPLVLKEGKKKMYMYMH